MDHRKNQLFFNKKDIDLLKALCKDLSDKPDISSLKITDNNPLYDLFIEFRDMKYELQKQKKKNKTLKTNLEKTNKEIEIVSRQLKQSIDESIQLNEELTCSNELLYQKKDQLEETQAELIEVNSNLENIIRNRTKKLNITVEKLNETVRALDRFVYSASHELSAPIKTMLGLANICKTETDHNKLDEYLYYIERTLTRLDMVTKHFLSYSKTKNLEVRKEEIETKELVLEIIDELNHIQLERSIDFNIAISESDSIICDRYRIHTILYNLIDNSIKYRNPDQESSKIEIRSYQEGNYYTLSVKDNGIGISENEIPKIFQMYHRSTAISEGSGLGLYIVKEVIDQLRGKIIVNSQVGVGTEIIMKLPHSLRSKIKINGT